MKQFIFLFYTVFIFLNGKAQTSFYGASVGGGIQDKGTIFKTDSNGNSPSIIYDFVQKNRSFNPEFSGLTIINNQVYGITYEGGKFGTGTIYKLNQLTNTIETVYDFTSNSGAPVSNLVLANNGLYYGLAQAGGTYSYGIVYSFDSTNNIVSIVHNFNINEMPNSVYHNNGILYFFSEYGGLNNVGDITSLNILTNVYSSLHSFDSSVDLATPSNHIFYDGVSKLYGTCLTDLTNRGGIFSYDILSNTYTSDTLYLYNKGFFSKGKLHKAINGLYYGTTQKGGSNNFTNSGTIYSFNNSTKTIDQVFQFNSSDGYEAAGNFIELPSGEIVGYTTLGGLNNYGVLYKFNIITNTYTKLFDFTSAFQTPTGQILLKGSSVYGNYLVDGNVFNSGGGLFEFNTISNTMVTIPYKVDQGINPSGGIVNDGTKLIGLSNGGGKYNCGTVYTINLNTNTKKDIYNFPQNSFYNTHKGRLVKAPNGKFYGTTQEGGTSGYGFIFEVDSQLDTVIVKYDFNLNYFNPLAEMTIASDGYFYGICKANGPVLGGTLNDAIYAFYKFDISLNTITILEHIYKSGSVFFEGNDFNGGMIEIGNTKQFLGTCSIGGVYYQSCSYFPISGGPGLVFKFDANTNVYNTLYDVRCGSQPYSYPDQVTNMIYLNQDSIFMANSADVDYVTPSYGRFGKIIQFKSTSNFYSERQEIKSFGNYLSFNSSPLKAKNKKFYLSSFDLTTTANSAYNNGSFFEYNPYTNSVVKKFDFNSYNIYSPFGGLVEINDNLITPGQDIWPGDANSDGAADNLDILELGLHYNQTGATRAATSNNWQSYFANNWTGTISNGKNLNHSDCNGDGIINDNDTLAIYNNYGLTHAFKPAQTNTVNPQLSIVPDQAMVTKGNWGTASVYLGEAATNITNINGVAFTVDFDNTLIEPNSIYIEYQNSFIDASQNLYFRKLDFANSKLFTASTHTVSNNVSGFGKIATLHYQIKSSLATDEVLNIGLSQANQSNASGVISPLTTGNGTLMAIGTSVGIKETLINGNVFVSPNPTNGLLNVNFSSLLQNTKIELYNSIGALVLTETMNNKNNTINISDLGSGMYFMKVFEGNKLFAVKKVVKE